MLKTKNPPSTAADLPHEVILQNGHHLEEKMSDDQKNLDENLDDKNQPNLCVNGTSIGTPPSKSLGAIPKQDLKHENSSSHHQNIIEDFTEKFNEKLSVKDENNSSASENQVEYIVYKNELQMPCIMKLIQKDLSEPYSIYTYRYFIHNWPHLCFMARVNGECVGAIVCKLDYHKKIVKRGYIAMLAVDSGHRKRKIGSTLVKRAIDAMIAEDADEVVLETEITNKPALRLYENLGFVRDKRLFRYYLNGVDALRLKLWLR